MSYMRIETLGGSLEANAGNVHAAFVADLMEAGSTSINLASGSITAPEVVEAAPDVSFESAQQLLGRLAI